MITQKYYFSKIELILAKKYIFNVLFKCVLLVFSAVCNLFSGHLFHKDQPTGHGNHI